MKLITPSLFLLPLAWLYDAATRCRNWMYACGILRQRSFPLPLIVVGNLSVGGTGKTPHTEYLLRLLSSTYRTAMLSRGYGRTTRGFLQASDGMTAADIGDEPWQVWHKFPQITVAVDGDRCEALDRLLSDSAAAPDVVVLDDAFQHRSVRAGANLLLTEHTRLYTDDWLLPAGRLRESARGARRAEAVVVTKCPATLSVRDMEHIRRRLALRDSQLLFFTRLTYGSLYPLFPDEALPVMSAPVRILAVTGIARPRPLLAHLRQGAAVVSLAFPDHHAFTEADLQRIGAAFSRLPFGSITVTTEKDAARLYPLREQLPPPVRRSLYVQPVEVRFLGTEGRSAEEEQKKFDQFILDYVARDKRNRQVD